MLLMKRYFEWESSYKSTFSSSGIIWLIYYSILRQKMCFLFNLFWEHCVQNEIKINAHSHTGADNSWIKIWWKLGPNSFEMFHFVCIRSTKLLRSWSRMSRDGMVISTVHLIFKITEIHRVVQVQLGTYFLLILVYHFLPNSNTRTY